MFNIQCPICNPHLCSIPDGVFPPEKVDTRYSASELPEEVNTRYSASGCLGYYGLYHLNEHDQSPIDSISIGEYRQIMLGFIKFGTTVEEYMYHVYGRPSIIEFKRVPFRIRSRVDDKTLHSMSPSPSWYRYIHHLIS